MSFVFIYNSDDASYFSETCKFGICAIKEPVNFVLFLTNFTIKVLGYNMMGHPQLRSTNMKKAKD